MMPFRVTVRLCLGCPTSVFITSSSGVYQIGSVLTCTSDGYPGPSYTWTDATSRAVVATGPNVTLSTPAFSLTCTANSDFANPCSASLTIVNSQHADPIYTTTLSRKLSCNYLSPSGRFRAFTIYKQTTTITCFSDLVLCCKIKMP